MNRRIVAVLTALSFASLATLIPASKASADTSISYDFNTAGSLTADFDKYDSASATTQSATGGIGNTGAISVPSGTANAVYVTKSSYSIGAIGSTYTFTAFMQSVGNSGYSGVGFTATAPTASTVGGSPYRPNDALGISVHGGGFVLHNASAPNVNGSWGTGGAGITTVKLSAISDLLNSGSPTDKWYKIIFKLTRDSATTFDTRIEVWSAYANGSLIRPAEADAIFEWLNVANADLINAPSIYSYINFSGTRVKYFDNYSIALGGGATVVAAGMPVVLSTSATNSSGVITFDGNVTGNGGGTVTERGFVYGTSASPTISDNKVAVGSGTGTFNGTTSTLSNGTYYLRAYATNGTGTSYGSDITVTVSGGASASPSATSSASASASPSASSSSDTNGGAVTVAQSSPSPTASTGAKAKSSKKSSTLAHTGYKPSPLLPVAMFSLLLGYIAYSTGYSELKRRAIIKWLRVENLLIDLKL